MTEMFGENYFYGKKESNYSNYDELNPQKEFKNVISFIRDNKLNGRFLDVGCAFGFLLKEVSPFFDEVYGCDISEFAISKARQKTPSTDLRIVNIEESLPYPDGMFDCITALGVLEHTRSFEKSFTNLIRKLRGGGYLIISVPVSNRMRKLFGFLDKDKTHISVLSKSEIIDITNKHKMEIVKTRYFCPTPMSRKIPYVPAGIEMVLKKE